MIQAISGDAEFLKMVGDGTFGGFIHSVFKTIINIRCSTDGDLYALAAVKTDNAPNTIRVDSECFDDSVIKTNDRVVTAGNYLKLGHELVVSLERATRWQSVGPGAPYHPDALGANLKTARACLEEHGVAGGMKAAASGTAFSAAMSLMLGNASERLIDDLARKDVSAALDRAGDLIGLGIGLTPSGDDFLVGLLAVLSTEESLPFKDFCAGVRDRACGATNAISYMAIKKAAAGQVRETIARLLQLFRSERKTELTTAIRDVLMIGATSGTDIAWGIIRGFELVSEIGGQGHGTQSRH